MKQLISEYVDLQNDVVFKGWIRKLAEAINIETAVEPTLINSWANDTGRTTKYYAHLGHLYIEGKLVSGSGVAFTLPEKYWPDEVQTFTNITIAVNGDVTPSVATSLDGINFRL